MKQKKKNEAWIGVEQLTNDPGYRKLSKQEFVELPLADTLAQSAQESAGSRRDFLKYLGFGLGAATLAAGCDIPVKRALPYVIKPDEVVPGVAAYYASSYIYGGDYCPVLVKTREGRPIKVEGNSLSSLTRGGTSARVQASVLSLYDTSRLHGPTRIEDGRLNLPVRAGGSMPSWEEIDAEIGGQLDAGSRIRIVTHTLMSPTSMQAINDFKVAFPNTEVVVYDPVSSAALLDANEACFGQRHVPCYHFDRAKVIVGIEADFLGTWISPIEFAAQYAEGRRIADTHHAEMSHHVQIESHMSLTGSNADNRILVKPSHIGAAVVALYNEVAQRTGGTTVSGPELPAEARTKLVRLAERLVENRGSSLVVCGSNNIGEQTLVNAINDLLGNYGETLDFGRPSMQRLGHESALARLIGEMENGAVDALFILEPANPAWDNPRASTFAAAMDNVPLKVSFSTTPNETTVLCNYALPDHHWLERWGDVEPKRGVFSLIQPTIQPLFKTRQWEETLLRWAETDRLNYESDQPFYEYLQAAWEQNVFPQQSEFSVFRYFWDSVLHDGVFELEAPAAQAVTFQGVAANAASQVRQPASAELELGLFETVNMGAGQYANNPWLQEMPDPVARTVWGNYLAIPIGWEGGNSFSAFRGLNEREVYGEADIVRLGVNGNEAEVTCVRQFGQMPGTLGLALGYGREVTGKMDRALGERVGVNVYPWLPVDDNGYTQYYLVNPSVSDKVETEELFACVQYHHTMGVTGEDPDTGETINVDEKTIMTLGEGYQGGLTNRSIIYSGNLSELEELEHHIVERREEAEDLNTQTLYPYDKYEEQFYQQGHWWAMHIDLNACIGCGACQVACIAENNVPVVGKREVARHHEMTWLRIDRYFYGDYENPNVVYQPMMCQHCDNAPCENVCPVNATNHSSEGLNQMIYNRCIGTRYCANNCPYKVRRFNWLDYTTADIFPVNEYDVHDEDVPFGADNLTRMVLNPDVTVRSRGVMEKCSFCAQRLQEGKLTAKREGRALRDEDVKTACQTACPTGAIVFGDRNKVDTVLAERMKNPLNYLVLEEINTRSAVNYQARVNNRDEALDA